MRERTRGTQTPHRSRERINRLGPVLSHLTLDSRTSRDRVALYSFTEELINSRFLYKRQELSAGEKGIISYRLLV